MSYQQHIVVTLRPEIRCPRAWCARRPWITQAEDDADRRHTDDGKTDLEPSIEGTFSVEIPLHTGYNERVLSFVTSPQPESSQSSEDAEFDAEDYAALERFKNRTVFGVGTETSQVVYQREMPRLAQEHSFLMHLLITLTLMHDRFLADVKLEQPSKQSESEAYHWYQG